MEKLNLFDAVNNGTLDSSIVTIEDAVKYTTLGNIYKSRYEEIGKARRIFARIAYIVGILFLVLGFNLVLSSMTLSDVDTCVGFLLVFIGGITVGVIGDLVKKADKIEHLSLKNEIVEDIKQLHFKEILDLANNNNFIFYSAFENARRLNVPEDKIEKYIKGYIKQKNDEEILEERRKEKEINDVIIYSEMH